MAPSTTSNRNTETDRQRMITVLTPTYNRSHTIERVFESLLHQTDKRFEWLVIDDGSTDDTHTLIQKLSTQADFKVRYFHQTNAGKHIAINKGTTLAETDWIFILDSDDALTPDAIATAQQELADHAEDMLLGICFRKAFFNGLLIGEKQELPAELYLHPTEAGKLLKGDLAYIFRRSALLAHPFPVISGEKFVPELYIWNKIGDDGKILFMTKKYIYLCEYLADGYSNNFTNNLKRNPRGFLIYYRSQFSREKLSVSKIKCAIRSLQCWYYANRKRPIA
jgi:glycosyltransferase involved in cell wall biosynthesis